MVDRIPRGSLHLLIYLAVGLFLLGVHSHYVGLSTDGSLFECILEALEELGLGLVLTLIILYITGRILPEMSYSEIIGKVVVEAVTVAIGISIGKSQLGGNSKKGKQEDDAEKTPRWDELNKDQRHQYLIRSVNLALCGSLSYRPMLPLPKK